MENIEKIFEILRSIPVTEKNRDEIHEIRQLLIKEKYIEALARMKELQKKQAEEQENNDEENEYKNDENVINEEEYDEEVEEENKSEEGSYPKKISDKKLEKIYIGLLLINPKLIRKYYFVFDDCFFEDLEMLNLYKSILYNEGSKYSSEKAKEGFNFPKETEETYQQKINIKEEIKSGNYNIEKVYAKLRKLFILRKAYLEAPESNIQNRIVEITDYELYDKMSADEIISAIEQINVTQKFKQAVLSDGLVEFLESGENELANGLNYPFPILTSVFKGIRKGETMAFAMPSNSGKSRLTINLAAYTALVHKKKILIISNEMSEEKMKLCLITTIINHPEIQKIHGQDVQISEGELLEFKFKPDNKKEAKLDESGYILKEEKETQAQFVKRLTKISSQFNKVIKAIEWASKQINNSIYFINITDHTNDELQKVIINYYYKEKIEYVFYDTLKTDTANIGNPEEIKKTATILSNLAQNFNIFICSSLQLAESSTSPINLNVNDLAVSRTVKEVLDTLCLFKQISRDNLSEYEYSLKEVDTQFYDLEKSDDPDVRYYSCVIDKNRAGAKPKLVFKINLAYNSWEELGYLRLKQN
ncbi:putative uncharacterized protein [Clostridium sp. CAG:575]|nr:putative uncharacterized protein [Clostridium sp. CAG:575]